MCELVNTWTFVERLSITSVKDILAAITEGQIPSWGKASHEIADRVLWRARGSAWTFQNTNSSRSLPLVHSFVSFGRSNVPSTRDAGSMVRSENKALMNQ